VFKKIFYGLKIIVEKEFLEKIEKKASEYDKYSGCSQSVLLALQEAFGIGDLESFKSQLHFLEELHETAKLVVL